MPRSPFGSDYRPPAQTELFNQALRQPARRPGQGVLILVALALLGLGAVIVNTNEKAGKHSPPAKEALPPKPDGNDNPAYVDPLARRLERARQQREAEARRQAEAAKLRAVEKEKRTYKYKPVPPGHVRVAAIQFYSIFGKPDLNRKRLEVFVRRAAKADARIVVLPEACIPGYANMEDELFWSRPPLGENHRDVRSVAEPADGKSFRFFAKLARELKLYLTVPIIEQDGEKLYNTVLLLDPRGQVCLRYRKQHLWDPGDTAWASAGNLGTPVIDTPYGRIAVMICYDMHVVLPGLKGRHVDFVLHSAAFYGQNFETYLRSVKFMRKLRASGANLVLANWTIPYPQWWGGYGLSRVYARGGKKRWRTRRNTGDMIVVADLPVGGAAAQGAKKSADKDAAGASKRPVEPQNKSK